MRALLQRVSSARVEVEGEIHAAIGQGLLVLLGVGRDDTGEDARWLAEKTAHLRIFEDDQGKMNRSLVDCGGGALVVSQFTLFGDTRRGRRPSFTDAASPESAAQLYGIFADELGLFVQPVERGVFQAPMHVHLVNDGPVTLWLDTEQLRPRKVESPGSR